MVEAARPMTSEERKVIFASSLGTVFEWYDFYLYGSLSAVIAKQFFSGVNPTAAFIFALLAFAAGFAVRPFGALFFGRLGDLVGRKYTFLVTILIMGLSTFIVGLLPSYATIGIAAPVILIFLRLLQGLALGGEYGGAATYVAEHAPHGKRGSYTAWIQTTATMGLFLSLLIILGCRLAVSAEDFDRWAWRIPFLLSILLLGVSTWIRLKLSESPAFKRMKSEGKTSKAPLRESFAHWPNLKIVLLALFGVVAGQAVVWYTGQFYALFFLTQTLKVDAQPANLMIAAALLIGTPFFVIFGALSDRIGRKPIIMAGLLLAILTYFPLFKGITHFANPALEGAISTAPVVVSADPADCSVQFNPVGTSKFTSSCDVAKAALVKRGVPYSNHEAPAGTVASVKVGDTVIPSYDATKAADAKAEGARFEAAVGKAATGAGYPAKADSSRINYVMTTLLLTILVIYVTMVYGPIAAMLVEMFPTRIRYTSMSLPYHIGNGWFGGFLPTTAFAIVAATGNIYSGLWYPIIVAAITLLIGVPFVRETRNNNIYAHD
ncbi:MHS family MFS transporter [Simulacricoccus sp. 17bor-14]|nr:MHS family MFS transporter [Simulacricoccus sp. 17bor-14]